MMMATSSEWKLVGTGIICSGCSHSYGRSLVSNLASVLML